MSTGSSAERLQAFREAAAKTKGFQCITALFDEGTFNEVDGFAKSGDGSAEVVAGYGEVDGCPAYAFVQNSDVDGGAMSKAQAAKIKKIYDLAVKTGSPVVGIYDSIGGRLNQGADMLAAYGEYLIGKQQPFRCCSADFPCAWPLPGHFCNDRGECRYCCHDEKGAADD